MTNARQYGFVTGHTSGAHDTKLTSSADNRDSESSRGETHAWESAELSVSGSQSFTTHSFNGESTDPSVSCSPSAMLKRNEENWNGEDRMEQNVFIPKNVQFATETSANVAKI